MKNLPGTTSLFELAPASHAGALHAPAAARAGQMMAQRLFSPAMGSLGTMTQSEDVRSAVGKPRSPATSAMYTEAPRRARGLSTVYHRGVHVMPAGSYSPQLTDFADLCSLALPWSRQRVISDFHGRHLSRSVDAGRFSVVSSALARATLHTICGASGRALCAACAGRNGYVCIVVPVSVVAMVVRGA